MVCTIRSADIDSTWLGSKGLAAIRGSNDFSLSSLPPLSLNLSTDQVIQPHRLNPANTRHIIPLGLFNTPSVRFPIFMLFLNPASNPRSMTFAKSNALSLERQKELYDKIIIPAAYETIKDLFN